MSLICPSHITVTYSLKITSHSKKVFIREFHSKLLVLTLVGPAVCTSLNENSFEPVLAFCHTTMLKIRQIIEAYPFARN